MEKVLDFKTFQAKKNGVLTLESLMENLNMAVEQGIVKDLVFVAIQQDGETVYGCNSMDAFRAVGILDTGKLLIQNDMYEVDDDE